MISKNGGIGCCSESRKNVTVLCFLFESCVSYLIPFLTVLQSLAYVATEIPSEEFSSGRLQANQHKNRDLNALPRKLELCLLFARFLASESQNMITRDEGIN